MCRVCSRNGEKINSYRILMGKTEGKRDKDIDGRAI
jgi:hypothetical protein